MAFHPIVIFAYKRPEHLRRTLESLKRCALASGSDLHVFCDGPKAERDRPGVESVRQYLRSLDGFRNVYLNLREENAGLARSVIAGVTQVLEAHGQAIILEDDLVFDPRFLQFMNGALDAYREHRRVYSVTGYSPEGLRLPRGYSQSVYLGPRHSSWGWGTYLDRWRTIDWEVADYPDFAKSRISRRAFNEGGGDLSLMLDMQMRRRMDSWSIRFDYSAWKAGGYSVAPVRSLVANIGMDGSGTHCDDSGSDDQERELLGAAIPSAGAPEFEFPRNLELNPEVSSAVHKHFSLSLKRRILARLGNFKARVFE